MRRSPASRANVRTAGGVVAIGAVIAAAAWAYVSRSSSGTFRADLAEAFFASYVSSDGRVIRHDQGGDTVSEGQAYAMLLAVALRDERRFDRVWTWTREHLQRDDGLLSWRYTDGRVVDPQPASDADIDAAYALLLASDRFSRDEYRSASERIADAVIDRETIELDGRRYLVAGPWARDKRVVNPSYYDFRALDAFDDRRWRDVRASGVRMLSDFDGLPPDWARISGGGVRPVAGPDADIGPGRYGLDALRVVVRSSVCTDTRRDAASWWRMLRSTSRSAHPALVVGAAAAAHAAGDGQARERLFAQAEVAVGERPSYYGSAWVALGRAMLDADVLGNCR